MLVENIRRLRMKKGLAQEKLARLADISTAALVKIEAGVARGPTITTVAKIANALDVSIDDRLFYNKHSIYFWLGIHFYSTRQF